MALKISDLHLPSITDLLQGRLAGVTIWLGVVLVIVGFFCCPWTVTNKPLMLGWAMILGGFAGDSFPNVRWQIPLTYGYREVRNWSTIGYVLVLTLAAASFGFAFWTSTNPVMRLWSAFSKW